jgi:hypothetical protein
MYNGENMVTKQLLRGYLNDEDDDNFNDEADDVINFKQPEIRYVLFP